MERVILYVDDAGFALEQLTRLQSVGLQPTHWVLAACAPRMSSRISKWVSHSARENWQLKWLARLQGTLAPVLHAQGAQVQVVLAQGPLLRLTQQLLLEHGAARVIDLRRPKVGATLEPIHAAPKRAANWSGSTLGVGVLALVGALLE